jgi:ketosteroid isomerase-like protein
MKTSKFKFPVFLFLFGILLGCAQEIKEADVEADIAAINEVYDKYCERVSANEFELFLTLWADDLRRMEPGRLTIIGKEDWRLRVRELWDQAEFKMVRLGETEIQVCGDQAFARGAVTLSSTPYEGGSTTHIDIKFLDVLKRQADGSWKIYIDCFNLNPMVSKDSIPSELLEEENPYY